MVFSQAVSLQCVVLTHTPWPGFDETAVPCFGALPKCSSLDFQNLMGSPPGISLKLQTLVGRSALGLRSKLAGDTHVGQQDISSYDVFED